MKKLGRKINFPTANIETENQIPGIGVYYTKTIVDNKKYKSATNIGYKPTVNGKEVTIETHILDFSGDLYDKEITIIFNEKIREEIKFNSIEELKLQIENDTKKIISMIE